jgi:hypothetical protein
LAISVHRYLRMDYMDFDGKKKEKEKDRVVVETSID